MMHTFEKGIKYKAVIKQMFLCNVLNNEHSVFLIL
jgi:hypothetical protein